MEYCVNVDERSKTFASFEKLISTLSLKIIRYDKDVAENGFGG